MIIDIGNDIDESVVKWKYNDKDKWRDADIDELIHLYENIVYCKDCRHLYNKDFCSFFGSPINAMDYCSYGERR